MVIKETRTSQSKTRLARVRWISPIVASLCVGSALVACSNGGASGGDGSSSVDGGRGDGMARNDSSMNSDGGTLLHNDAVGPVDVSTTLPAAPPLANVRATQFGSNSWIDFDPVDNARDYRVYVLPAAGDIAARPDGVVNIHNGTYRCSGKREASGAGQVINMDGFNPEGWVSTHVEGPGNPYPYTRTMADATLGYVYASDGADRVPVYALGDPTYDGGMLSGDNIGCGTQRWQASRVKLYTTSQTERAMLISQHWRDDGIVFWAPNPGGSTRVVHRAVPVHATPYSGNVVFPDGAEHDAVVAAHSTGLTAPTPMFSVFTSQMPDTVPLMRLYYLIGYCGLSHDELTTGMARFQQILTQGQTPINHLLWSGETGPTTLVIEALDTECPYQGDLSPTHLDPTAELMSHPDWPLEVWRTVDEIRATSPTAELFVNGQGAATNTPRAIARSFVNVQPATRDAMDWSLDFAHDALPLQEILPTMGYATHHASAPGLDAIFINIEGANWTYGTIFGEFWLHYTDVAADTNGKVRFTPTQMATLSANTFIHAALETDFVTSTRRYPQIFVSTALPPIQAGGNDYGPNHLTSANTVLMEPIGFWPYSLQIQRCDHRDWDVNNQCPNHAMTLSPDGHGGSFITPAPEVSEFAGVDRTARFDVFASTTRAYVFVNGAPMGCADYSASPMDAGAVTVTFGDVLYHSDVDVPTPMYQFHSDHLHRETRRHWDYIGFSSNVQLPAWDNANMPCGTDFQM